MGNLIPGIGILMLFGWIFYTLRKSIKTTGSTCASCKGCPVITKCETDDIKNEILDFYHSTK